MVRSTEPSLLNCPFCGGEPQIERSFSGGPYVLCDHCGAATMFAARKVEAINLWNTRPEAADEITRLNAENEELREGLESIKLLVGDAFSGEVGAAQALDAVSDVATALITKASRDSGHETRT